MAYILLTAAFIAMVAQFIAVKFLVRNVPPGSTQFDTLFQKSNPWITQGIRHTYLKSRFLLPWVKVPDLSAYGVASRRMLFARVASSIFVVSILASVVSLLAGWNHEP